MATLLHLSDTHFGTERPEVVEALLGLAQRERPDVAVLSGDITQRATWRQFAAARRFMDRLAAHVKLVVPGNHDLPLFNPWARALHPYRNFARAFGDERQTQLSSTDWLVLCLDTTRPWRHKHGELSDHQVQRVSAALARATPRQLRVVVTHQPVLAIRESDRVNLLRGHETAVPQWVAAGADLLLGGHIHLPYLRPAHERWPGLPRPAWVLQAGTAVSHRLRERISNSVNLVRHEPDTIRGACHIERWDYDDTARAFGPVHTEVVELDR